MRELLDYLAANGFTNYIASDGGRDFMRPIYAAGNSNGDIVMLRFASQAELAGFALLLHVPFDDAEPSSWKRYS